MIFSLVFPTWSPGVILLPPVILLAILLDILFGDPPNRFHPVALMGRYIAVFWKHKSSFRKHGAASHPEAGSRHLRELFFGMMLVVSGMALFGLPWIVLFTLPIPLLWVAAIPLLKISFSIRGLFRASMDVYRSLERGDLQGAQKLVGYHLVSRNTKNLSEEMVAGAVVESLAENITDSLTSPFFYFLLFGIPGAWVYRFVNTCDSMIAYRDSEHEWGGKFAAALDTLLNWLPARFSGFCIVGGAAFAGSDWRKALSMIRREHSRTQSRNAGWTMTAMAGALGIKLEKESCYLIGEGNPDPSIESIKSCRKIVGWAMGIVVFVFLLITAGLVLGGIYAVLP